VDTYDAERQPAGRLMIEQAYTRYVLRTAPYLGTDDVQPLVDDLSLEIGDRYRSAAVVQGDEEDDGMPYTDPRESRALPGTRAPHCWLELDGRRLSTLDLFGRRFALLTGSDGAAWSAAFDGAEVDVHRLGGDDFHEAYGISSSGAVLVRPDGYVGWRAGDNTDASEKVAARVLASLLSRPAS
jgi:hypothetical protein